ncbi:MAG: hypothetical protein GTO45_24585 [Candidatus Aminicenantes bacterium]|nr:hypothetical protein [Candidatus Aminicenantes bacterium]NIM81932.1 hypothetical protein [Candidatus Aminicenantes bacterium]NIN21309.1 hypothetical protein [Candidatus Aminicenantes bacterium]NIN45130.1 hypothetical protein [Candidatus Aminicenantes bacterium]NIN87947.1 hypothetical protein [Candidatus Aminicenantes bacterium]
MYEHFEDFAKLYKRSKSKKEEGGKIGIKEAFKEGLKEGKIETARELIKLGVDINIIAKATGFSKEEIEKLCSDSH